MSATHFLSELRAKGVILEPNGDRLIIEALPSIMTPELAARLKAFKPELLAMLTSGAAANENTKPSPIPDPSAAYRTWKIYYEDREPVEVAYTPAATFSEVMEFQRGAIAAEPIRRADTGPETLASGIGGLSSDQSIDAEREAHAAIARAAARVKCQECAIRRAADGVCRLAIFGGMPGARDGHVPDPATPRCCAGFVPKHDAADQRIGAERWPHLAARWPHFYKLRADQ